MSGKVPSEAASACTAPASTSKRRLAYSGHFGHSFREDVSHLFRLKFGHLFRLKFGQVDAAAGRLRRSVWDVRSAVAISLAAALAPLALCLHERSESRRRGCGHVGKAKPCPRAGGQWGQRRLGAVPGAHAPALSTGPSCPRPPRSIHLLAGRSALYLIRLPAPAGGDRRAPGGRTCSQARARPFARPRPRVAMPRPPDRRT